MQIKNKKIKKLYPAAIIILLLGLFVTLIPSKAEACCSCPVAVRSTERIEWDINSSRDLTGTVPMVDNHVTKEFEGHRKWLIDTLFNDHLLLAMQKMTTQLTAIAMQQTVIFGTFFDAKHQLETQRLYQKIQAQAHKDYHPSVGMCEFGSSIKSLAATERTAELNALAMSEALLDRHLGTAGNASAEGRGEDLRSRLEQYDNSFCDTADNNAKLDDICPTGATNHKRINNDINYSKVITNQTMSEIDFTDGIESDDEKDVLALAKNLYGHRILPRPTAGALATPSYDSVNATGKQQTYMDARSLIAKRSVAENSFGALIGMKSKGSGGSTTFLKALLENLDIPSDDATKILGDNPSYDTQMDILTKKIYQNPDFYTNLYDTPTNVVRKQVAMQAIGLMQKFDTLKSYLRSEASLSVLLEMNVSDLQNTVENPLTGQAGDGLGGGGGAGW